MTAIIYTRVSTDEQAEKGFSLRDQKSKLERYCSEKGITIAAHFEDDYSAKTFERPAFKKLIFFLEKNKGKVQKLLVVKFDRFTRNIRLGLNMLSTLQSLGVTFEAIEQPLDDDIPENLLMQAIYLAVPQVENQRRSLNTTNGMRRAMKEGRYVSGAPHGFLNSRDSQNKPLLIPDPKKAPLIQRAFEMISTGNYSQNEVRREIWKQGLKLSRSRMAALLQNPIYCGLLQISAYKDEPSQIVKGIHEPLISEALFYKVQDVLTCKKRKNPPKHLKVKEALPLRGFLYCNNHDHRMTGSCSHGRNDKYHYYHCDNKIRCERHRAETVNKSFVDLLKSIQIKKEFTEIFGKLMEYTLKPDTSQIGILKAKIDSQNQRLQILQDRFIDGHITAEDYQQIRARYESALFDLNNQKEAIESFSKEFNANFSRSLNFLENIAGYYDLANTEIKRKIIGSITSGKVYFYESKCRTAELNPLIMLISNNSKAFSTKEILRTGTIRHLVPCGDPHGTQSRTALLIEGAKKLSDCLKLVA